MGGWPEARERSAPGRRRGRRSGSSPDPDGPDTAPPAGGPHAEDDPGDPEQVARSICLRALTGAAKTRQQLADLLAKRGFPDDVAERVLDRFGEVGLIDDAAFARAWVTSRQAGRGLARRALKAELRAKGVDGEDAEQALALVDDEDERTSARRLVHVRGRSARPGQGERPHLPARQPRPRRRDREEGQGEAGHRPEAG